MEGVRSKDVHPDLSPVAQLTEMREAGGVGFCVFLFVFIFVFGAFFSFSLLTIPLRHLFLHALSGPHSREHDALVEGVREESLENR